MPHKKHRIEVFNAEKPSFLPDMPEEQEPEGLASDDPGAASLAHYRQMAEYSLDGIVITDLDGRVLIANPAVLGMLEVDSTTASRPLTVFDFVAPESMESARQDFFSMQDHLRGTLRTYRAVTSRGRRLFVEVVGNRIQYDGEPANIISVRDVTRRHAMEDALRTSEQKFELLANTSIDIINYHTADLNLTYVSPAVRAILGYEPHELCGRNLREFACPEDFSSIRGVHEALVNGDGESATLEYRMFHRDGHVIWLESTVHAIPDPADGRVREFYTITRDITLRKRAEETAHRRDRVLHGFATASGFLLTGRLRDPIPRVLETMGDAMGADVAYIYEDVLPGAGGRHTAVRRSRWARETTGAPGVHRTGTCGEGHHFPAAWSQRLASGVWISGCISRFSGTDRDVLEDLQILAILLVPVFVRGKYWGFIGVSDRTNDRIWADTEIEILMTLAATIGLIIETRPEVFGHQ
jgi:PAS domain S-box-containing protein